VRQFRELVVAVGDERDLRAVRGERAAELEGVMDHAAFAGGLEVYDLHDCSASA
jgi:hypothetical protein